MSLTTRVLIGLAAGVGLGLVLSELGGDASARITAVVEPVGTLFLNGIRMTVIPLVVSMLVTGVATSGGRGGLARIGLRGVVVFVVMLIASGAIGALVAPPIISRVDVSAAAAASLRAHAVANQSAISAGATALRSPADWVVSLVPPNAIRAAADGDMLPLIVVALLLGLALASMRETARAPLLALFRSMAEAMLVLVRWLLVVAPIGVFALALPLVARMGMSAVGALAAYVVLVSVAALLVIALQYPLAVLVGGVPLREFARAAAPAQAVAISARSSLAALPALMDGARERLGLPEEITGFFLPLASAMFRVGATLGLTTGAVFIGHLYGVPISNEHLLTIVVVSVITSFSIPGIPGGSIIAMVPVLASAGLPLEGLGILLGVDTIPDMFRTTANVTGQLASATVVARGSARPAPVAAEA